MEGKSKVPELCLPSGKKFKTDWTDDGQKLFSLLIFILCENEFLNMERTLNTGTGCQEK